MDKDSRDKCIQAICNEANNYKVAAKERIEKEYGFIEGVDAMLWSIQNYLHAGEEKMERSEEESQEEKDES